MPPRLLLDEHISPKVAELLAGKGIDALAVAASPLAQSDDLELLRAAVREGRIFVTYDHSDFAEHLSTLTREGVALPGIIFVPISIRTSDFSGLAGALERLARRIQAGEIDPSGGVFLTRS